LNLRPLGYERYFRGYFALSLNSILGSIGDKLPSQSIVSDSTYVQAHPPPSGNVR
jgi:hypothetical protein